jgi:integrase
MKPRKKSRSVITVGREAAEIKIYTLRPSSGYTSYQCCWYDLGRRQTRTFSKLPQARLFAQQKSVALANSIPEINEATLRDVEVMKSCESRAAKLGFTLPAAMEEWFSARQALSGVSLAEAAHFYNRNHAGIPRKTVDEVLPLFFEAKAAAKVSETYLKVSRCYMSKFSKQFGPTLLTDVTTPEIDRFLRGSSGASVTKNNIRRTIVTVFTWARSQGYLEQDKKTTAERAMTFLVPDDAPAIWTPAEMRTLLAVCPPNLLPLVVIGGFCGIRSAEIARLEWQDVLWEQGYIEVKARKAKTKARRLVPLRENVKRWLEPHRKSEGLVCQLSDHSLRLNYLGEKAGLGWRQNALRHSYASYRLAEIHDAAKVALELGNSPEKLFKHYRELVTPDAAHEWFSIMLENDGIVAQRLTCETMHERDKF